VIWSASQGDGDPTCHANRADNEEQDFRCFEYGSLVTHNGLTRLMTEMTSSVALIR
jgi:hypothetical protein